jgi:hypothetical protein
LENNSSRQERTLKKKKKKISYSLDRTPTEDPTHKHAKLLHRPDLGSFGALD